MKHSFTMVRVSPVNLTATKTWGTDYSISGTGLINFLQLPLSVF